MEIMELDMFGGREHGEHSGVDLAEMSDISVHEFSIELMMCDHLVYNM